MKAELLHVVTVYCNPMRWQAKHELFRQFLSEMVQTGVKITVVECGFGDRDFEWHDYGNISVVHVRTNTVNWNKENLLNIGISRLPQDWEYVAWVDGDIRFRHQAWASEAINALQQYPIIQPWSYCYDLGPHGEHLEGHRSFAYMHWHRRVRGIGQGYEFAHPGYAWASRRDVLDRLGGLYEMGVSGAGDHHMALGLIGKAVWSIPGSMTDGYKRSIYQWQERATKHISGLIGHLHGTIEHSWHGRKKNRRYIERWDILKKSAFDPYEDLKFNTWRVMELAGNKPELAHDLDRYFRQRNEDGNEME